MEITQDTGVATEGGATAGDSTAAPLEATSDQSTASTKESGTEVAQATATAEPAWAPTYKFKANDKELEFDDFVKPIIKTKDHEQKLKEIYEKAYGLDDVKATRKAAQEKAKEFEQKYTEVETSLKTLGQYVKNNDFKTFFEALNIPKDKIIQYAIEELKYQEMPPEQRAQLDAQRQQQMTLQQLEQQNQTYQQQMASLIEQQTRQELTMETSKPEVATVIQAYDARAGKPGAFMSEVIKRGQYYEVVHKISPPASQLVQEVLQLVGGTAIPQQTTQSNAVVPQKQKPTIPAFSGGSSKSPAKRVPTSINDLREMRQQMRNE